MRNSDYSSKTSHRTITVKLAPGNFVRVISIRIVKLTKNFTTPRPQPNWKLYGNQRPNRLRNDNDGDEYKVAVANGVFVQQGFSIRPDYQSAVLGVYKSNMQSLDFARDGTSATKYINE